MPFSPIAKSKDGGVLQSFEGHTLDALNIFGDYVNKNRLVLNDFASNFQIEYDILMNLIFLSVYLHDLGKLTREFQKRIVVGEQSGYFSHAFFGLPCVNSDLPAELNSMLKLLVLSHHTQLYNNIYEGAKLANNVNYLNEYIKYWIESSKDIYINYFSSLFDMLFYPSYMLDDYFHDTDLNEAIKEEVWQLKYKQSKNSDKRTKALYSLCISILKHCDQKSSKCFQERNLSEGTYGSLLNKSHEFLNYANYDRLEVFNISKDLIVKFPEKDKPAVLYPFQERLSALDRSCIISAPCGRGKTEGALLCALNILKRRNKNKIIFALPTQITSNAMYERLKRIFGINNVGLYHGMSRYHHYEENDLKEEDIRNIVYDEKVFEKAITITTIDHLIYSLIHGYKQADFALGNILNSVVIFDEIHYYEPHTLRYVMDCLRIFKDLNIPYITMSGTLPNFIINELNKIQAHEFVEDVEGMKFSPFIIRKESKSIFEAIDEIESIYNDRKNQIIILNTIPRAKQMYNLFKDKIPKEELCLLHSQFTFSDRREKEKMILGFKNKKPWIIISTQAIEISVDISSDIMRTELAPVDALGQRGGRLNRGGKYHNDEHYMHIYEPENHLPYFPHKETEDFVERTKSLIVNAPLTYGLINNWCNQVYSGLKLVPQNLELTFKKCTLFGYSPKEIRYSEEKGNLVDVREESYPTIDVIPEKCWDKIRNYPKIIDKYKVKIPKWWYIKFRTTHFFESEEVGTRRYMICSIPYSEDYGFHVEKIGEERDCCIIC